MTGELQGKRVLITGGNSGIGLAANLELAKQGAELVLACRDGEKTREAWARSMSMPRSRP